MREKICLKRNQKTSCGRFIVDGIVPISAIMLSSVGLEVMNLTNPELNWKSVTKGRRSKKSVAARNLKGVAKAGNSTSPKWVGDFSGSDSDKVGERSCNWQSRGNNESAKFRFGDQTKREYNDAWDFSGIELLAAAASMDDEDDVNANANANKQDLVAEDSLIPNKPDASASATQCKVYLKSTELEDSLSKHGGSMDCSLVLGNFAVASQSLCGSPGNETMPKVSRKHWDLNTLMDAWCEPYNDSIAENTSNDDNDGTNDEYSNMKIEENKLTTVSPDRICSLRPNFDKHLVEPPSRQYSIAAAETSSYEAAERNSSERDTNKTSNSDGHMNAYNEVMIRDSILDSSPFTKPSSSSAVLKCEEKMNSTSGHVGKIPEEDCSSDARVFERSTATERILTRTQDFANTSEISESSIIFQCKHNRDYQKSSEPPGTFLQDGRVVPTAASEMQNDENFASGSTITVFQGHSGMAAPVAKHEDNILPSESTRNVTKESSKSCSAGAQCDNPFLSVGKIGSNVDGPPNSNIFQNNHVNMVNGDDLNGFHEGYDSPYEDGELRGSFLYSWGDNEMEDECIDYESDGRNGDDGSDGADYPGSEIVEGGIESLHCTVRSSSFVEGFSEGKSKGEPTNRSLRSPVKNDPDNNEIAGKGSKSGSGTTVEQSMQLLIDENDEGMKRSTLTDRRDAVGGKLTRIDEYKSKTARGGKLQPRIAGRPCMDADDGEGGFIIQQCRSRRLGSYSRSERDVSPNKYLGRYRPATHGERDGVHQWTTSWGSRRRYNTSSYQGFEGGRPRTWPRSKDVDFSDKIDGLDYHDPIRTNYLPKGLHRPFMRRPPVERDDFFGARRRVPPTRGAGNYRGRGHYTQRGGRVFEPSIDNEGPPVPMPRYLSKRERSFSPSFRNSQIPSPQRRSRSRSRTRSPRAWHPDREPRVFGNNNRRNIRRSPDFRERMRMPSFQKPNLVPDYGDGGYISPPRGRPWVGDHSNNFADNHLRRRRSPVRVFRRAQRFDSVEFSAGRLKSGEYFRPRVTHPRKFSLTPNGGNRDCNLELGYDDRRREDGGGVMQRDLRCDDGGNMRRFRNNAVKDFEMGSLNKLNNEDAVPRDVARTEGDGEDKSV